MESVQRWTQLLFKGSQAKKFGNWWKSLEYIHTKHSRDAMLQSLFSYRRIFKAFNGEQNKDRVSHLEDVNMTRLTAVTERWDPPHVGV